jgi:DNA-binding CsgD family transcriptional regulator/PAS domain-containing protein
MPAQAALLLLTQFGGQRVACRTAITTEAVSDLLLTLYEAPTRQEQWHVFLREFARMLNLPAVAIQHQNFALHKYRFDLSFGMDLSVLTQYEQHFGRVDPYWPQMSLEPEGVLAFGEQLCPTSQLLRTEFYNDFLATHEVVLGVYASIATIKRPNNLQVITMYQRLEDDPPAADTPDIINIVIPHIRAALRLQQHMDAVAGAGTDLASGFDAMGYAVVLLDERAACTFFNRRAEQIFGQRDGLLLRHNHLIAERPAETAALSALIDATTSTAIHGTARRGAPVLISRSGRRPLKVAAIALSRSAPLVPAASPRAAVVLVLIRDPDDDRHSLSDVLPATYGLTRAESCVAVRLFEGLSLAETADAHGVSKETVRQQLKSIFEKTGTRRQSELLKLLCCLSYSL